MREEELSNVKDPLVEAYDLCMTRACYKGFPGFRVIKPIQFPLTSSVLHDGHRAIVMGCLQPEIRGELVYVIRYMKPQIIMGSTSGLRSHWASVPAWELQRSYEET